LADVQLPLADLELNNVLAQLVLADTKFANVFAQLGLAYDERLECGFHSGELFVRHSWPLVKNDDDSIVWRLRMRAIVNSVEGS
jgi:hypothetical protein